MSKYNMADKFWGEKKPSPNFGEVEGIYTPK
jgi:hypothetical protein